MKTLKFFITIAFVLVAGIGSVQAKEKGTNPDKENPFKNGITYQSFFDPRAASAPTQGYDGYQAYSYESFFDPNLSAEPAKGPVQEKQSPMLCYGGNECLWH